MSRHDLSPRSQRPRYRARSASFSFAYREGRILEESTGLELPSLFPQAEFFAHIPGLEVHSLPYNFDPDGRPDTDTHHRLSREMCAYLFVVDGRIRPHIPDLPRTESERDWNRYLASLGYGVDQGLAPWERTNRSKKPAFPSQGEPDAAEDDLQIHISADFLEKHRQEIWGGRDIPPPPLVIGRKRRSLELIAPSEWRRALAGRLATILDRPPDDELIQRMALLLSDTETWGSWGADPALRPLRVEMFRQPWRWLFVMHLERIAFERWEEEYSQKLSRQPLRATIKDRFGEFVFEFPRRPRSLHRVARRAFAAVNAYGRVEARQGGSSASTFAAMVWLAGRFLREPRELRQRKLTLHRVAKHFGVTARQVHYAAQKFYPLLPALPKKP